MQIGIVGAPNKGKTTLFSAMTMVNAQIADYPFTTIKPNFGVAYVTKKCPDAELGVHCSPKNSICMEGTRLVPINIIDVAGLVPGAHLGKGMGNQFLNDLAGVDALIQVVDASGRTDVQGNPCSNCDPAEDVLMIADELAFWLSGIIKRHMNTFSRRSDGAVALKEILTSFNVSEEQIVAAANRTGLPISNIAWSDSDINEFSRELLKASKPIIVAANKTDISSSTQIDELKRRLKGYTVVPCSAAIELALRKAAKSGVISYVPGSREFDINKEVSKEQEDALNYMRKFISEKTTGVQELINKAAFDLLRMIVVYPVEDENKYTDHYGNVLPDAILVKEGTTAEGLAARIHTDLAKHMLYAIDARSKMRLPKSYVLKDNDIIKIVSAAK
ncbi:MAG: redox-regulated ATPase YchF [Candidatus Micrarchaeia archaeon]